MYIFLTLKYLLSHGIKQIYRNEPITYKISLLRYNCDMILLKHPRNFLP